MPVAIPLFPEISQGHNPGWLTTDDTVQLRHIHEELRCKAARRPDQFERLACKAVQKCYDLLEGIEARRGPLKKRVLEERLPPKILNIALECGWLPAARTDIPAGLDWIKRLLAGRFSRIGLEDVSIPEPYLFAPFPVGTNSGMDAAAGQLTAVGEPESIPSESGLGEKGVALMLDKSSKF